VDDLMQADVCVSIRDLSSVGEARRAAAMMAGAVGLSVRRASNVAIVVTEAASNIVRHADGKGELLLRPLGGKAPGIEVLAIDCGQGIANVSNARRDGYSTAGSAGEGLGAIARQASAFDMHSVAGQGTTVMARIWEGDRDPSDVRGFSVGAVSLPKPGEVICGDSWSVAADADRVLVLVADGLGHGLQAADASRRAVQVFQESLSHPLPMLMSRLHEGLRATRGAAVAIAAIRPDARELRYVGVGNIAAAILGDTRRALVSHNGTAGAEARRVQEFLYPWPDNGVLIMHSDGLSANWDLARHTSLRTRHCALIAATLYRDHRRQHDDVTIVTLGRGDRA
jgi:anti-sigma regulatory factor (Ser/Thr protein kinase)